MTPKYRLAVLGALLLLLFSLHHASRSASASYTTASPILFANPLLLKASSGPYSALLADRLWLIASSVDEQGIRSSKDVNVTQMFFAYRGVITLDPHFTLPIIYAATYFSSIHQRLDLALTLIDHARTLGNENFDLVFMRFLLRLTYGEALSAEEIRDIIVKLSQTNQYYFGDQPIDDLVINAVGLSHNSVHKRQKTIEDLKWLLKNTEDKRLRKRIQYRLNKLEKTQ